MRYRFTLKARLDLYDAARFYDDQRPGLGVEFGVEAGLAINKILESPQSWPEVEPGVYRYRLDRFPYGIYYRVIDQGNVEIEAVFDLRSEPGSWRKGINP
jgi:hypothetical protein